VWPDGHISTVAGNGGEGFSGDGGPATRASLAEPAGVAALADGGFVIADASNYRVRRVWPDGRIATVAGNGSPNLSGDGRRATSAGVADVASLAGAPGGGFLIAATNSPTGRAGAVRRVWPDGHISSLVAGVNGADYGDGGPATAAGLYRPDGEATSVAALPDGGTLIGYGTSVRLIVGRHGSRLLAAAIRSPAGVASAREYRARVVLTRPAHVTLRVYHSLHGRPVAIARDDRPAGESTVTIPFNRRVTPGLYAIDLTARRRSQATRAEQYVYLGGSVTRGTIRHIESQTLEDEFGNDPNAQAAVDRCHQYTALRVDCLLSEYDTYVEALWLTPQGQLRARTYRPDGPEAFNPNPHWNGPAIWADLGAAWNP
jgi:hypothetical protein